MSQDIICLFANPLELLIAFILGAWRVIDQVSIQELQEHKILTLGYPSTAAY